MIMPTELRSELHGVGVEIEDLWELVNTRQRYEPAIPILEDWLAHLEARVPKELRARVEEPIVRALTIPAARKSAIRLLIERFELPEDPSRSVRWAIGNALGALAGDEFFDELEVLIREKKYGRGRQQLARAFGRSKDPRAVPLLLDLLEDEDIVAHAVEALARHRDPRARAPLEALLTHPLPLVRREAAKALKKLPGGYGGTTQGLKAWAPMAPHSGGEGSWCEKGANNERRANRNNHRCSFCVGVGCLRPFCRVSLVLEQTGMADAASVDLDESENRGHDPG